MMKSFVAWALRNSRRAERPFVPGRFRLNVVKDSRDGRDYVRASAVRASLPRRVDYSEFVTVKNQGTIGSCGSHAAVTGLEMVERLNGFKWPIPLSELFHYWVVRQKDYYDSFPEDSGQDGRSAMKVLNKVGVCPEELDPYNQARMNERPGVFAFLTARFWKSTIYERCVDVQAVKSALAAREAVWLGVPVQEGIFANRGQVIRWDSGLSTIGGHAMEVVGFDESSQTLKVDNSWGVGWGSGGFGYFSYDYLDRAKWFDAWSFR